MMKIFFFTIIVGLLMFQYGFGGSKKTKKINVESLIENLNGNLICLIAEFFYVLEFEKFFQNYNMTSEKKNQCRVEHQTRFYGHFSQEYFAFEKNFENVNNRFLPSTINQMFSIVSLIRSHNLLFELISYKSGYLEILKYVTFRFHGPPPKGWNQNVASIFPTTFYRTSDTRTREHWEGRIIKIDGSCLKIRVYFLENKFVNGNWLEISFDSMTNDGTEYFHLLSPPLLMKYNDLTITDRLVQIFDKNNQTH